MLVLPGTRLPRRPDPQTPGSLVRLFGSIVAWGDNADGQLDVPAPNADFVAVAGREHHSLGLKASPPPICPWDMNDDGSVGAADLLALLVSWGPCKGCPTDFDGNCTVGASDLLALLVNWGPCP